MQPLNKILEHRGIDRLRELGALALMLVAMSLITSCGGGSDNGSGNGGGQSGGEQAGNAGGGNGGNGGGDTGGAPPPISDIRVIMTSLDNKTLNGSRVRLKDAEVRNTVSERAFFIGENDAEQLLVLNMGDGVGVGEGQKVLVAGRLNTPRPELEGKLSLNPEEAAAVNEQKVFIRASRVTPQ